MRPNFSIADEIRSNFSFLDENDYEMHLSLQADRSIRGEIISRGTGQRVATINGVNDTPGILRLSAIGTDTKFNFDDVAYRIRPAREGEKKNNAPVVDPVRVWDRTDGKHSLTPFIACFKLCDKTYDSAYDEKSERWGWSTNPEAAEFDTIASWSVEWDNFAVGWLILKGTTKNAKMAVEELSKTIHPTSFEKNADVFEIYVPPGLEDDALKLLREKGVFKNNVTRGHYERGTTTNLMAFKRGTFFAEKPSSASYLDMLPAVKDTIRNSFEKMGLDATVSQAPMGGFAFVVNFSGRGELKLPNNSALLEKMAGAWINSQAQIVLSTRPEPNIPAGYIEVADIYIVQSRFFMSPSNYKPKSTDVFLVAEKVDPTLDSTTLDYNLLNVITENLAVGLGGGILYGDAP